ncbi:DUF6470 family protein [Paenibacillus shenyangensis]|uniref:DUF6470 family protein n=1 Tax=Paenibacillus sp. A9 TaxID=1284352 RepID=UPI0003605508|nr:DUF6470 family protein [Paenibacillus sp. A9]
MTSMPIVQIRQTPGRIGIETTPGSFSIRQPKADLQITTQKADLEIQQPKPELTIDQSRALAAYDGGSHLEMTKRLYSNVQQLFLQGLSQRMKDGERMREFYKPGNTLGDIMKSRSQNTPGFIEYRGAASSDNVDIQVERRDPIIEVTTHKPDIQVQINRPEIEYTRGNVNIYMQQYPSVQFIPPEIDTTM